MKTSSKKIFEQTTTGGAVVNAGGHVDLAAGLFDRPGPQNPSNFGEKPIVPSEMVANQLAVQRPPVDDNEYVPSSKQELGLAVSEISKAVPDEQIQKFYLAVKDLAQKSIDEEQVEEFDEKGKVEMQESRKMQDKILEFLSSIDSSTLIELRQFSAHECIEILERKKIVTSSKAQSLRHRAKSLIDESIFKRFFISSMVLPSMKKNMNEVKASSKAKLIIENYSSLSLSDRLRIFEKICR